MSYKNLSVGRVCDPGQQSIYAVADGKKIDGSVITFINLGDDEVTVSVYKGNGGTVHAGDILVKQGYGCDSVFYGLQGEMLNDTNDILVSSSVTCDIQYSLVGIETDA